MPPKTEIDYDKIMMACEKPFAFEDHAPIMHYDKIGAWYIKKVALRRRLFEVDRFYSLTPPDLISDTDDVVLMRGGLNFVGRTVYALGSGVIQKTKTQNREVIPLEGYDLARSIAKTQKTAASDLLPRLCLEVNIGAYMRDLPRDSMKSIETFSKWLDGEVQAWERRWHPHWAANGKGHLFADMIKAYGLNWQMVSVQLEPGRTLQNLRDISLSDVQAFQRLAEMKAEMVPIGGV